MREAAADSQTAPPPQATAPWPRRGLRAAFQRLSIRIRLLLASTIIQVVLLSLLLANSGRLMNEAASASLATMVSQNATMLHAMAAAYGEQGRYSTLQDVLGELLADAGEGLVYVRIGRPDGELLVSAGMPEMNQLPPPGADDAAGGLSVGLPRALIHVRRPLLLPHNEVGFLQFGVSASPLTLARQAIIRQGAAIALIEIVLTIVLLSGVGYLLTRKLGRLLAGSQAIAEGHLDHRIPEGGHDELARLSHHFNLMAAHLQARIGELQEAARRLHASEERYALAIRGANDGLWDWDIAAGTVYLSPRFHEIAGHGTETLPPHASGFFHLLHPEDEPLWRQRLIAHLKGQTPQFMLEHRIRQQDGSYRWVQTRGVALHDERGRAVRMAGAIGDIHQRKEAEARLQFDALHDGLTGLPNRTLFIEHLDRALGLQRCGSGQPFAVLTINLERFRLVNDSFGHAAGDELLRRLGGRIAAAMRDGDIAARVGGDQFALLLNGIAEPADALPLAEALRMRLAEPTVIAGHTLHSDCRIGVALSAGYQDDAQAMLRDADNALHRARQGGITAVAVFDASMHVQALSSLQLEADLRTALREGAIDVHFQPIVSIADGRVTSFEALARWRHPTAGQLSPGAFVPLAETIGLIHELGMQVLDRVCERLLAWQRRYHDAVPPVSVNLSGRQLGRPRLADEIIARVAAHRVAPQLLRFEVTESIVANPDGPAAAHLERLREAGMAVLIDDFGTGFSALSYLHTIPCDVLKLDGSFVRSIVEDKRLRAIVGHSIRIAHDLGMKVVAECIETAEQAALLHGIGCDYGQGYFYSRPLDDEGVARLLAALPDAPGAAQ